MFGSTVRVLRPVREGRVVLLREPLLRVEKIWGRSRDSKARVPGRQAQMIATLHSMADQAAAPTLSSIFHVRSRCIFTGSYGARTYRLGHWSWKSPEEIGDGEYL